MFCKILLQNLFENSSQNLVYALVCSDADSVIFVHHMALHNNVYAYMSVSGARSVFRPRAWCN